MSTSTGSVLNANAPSFQPDPDRRRIFFTLSNGFPLTEFQVYSFFNWIRIYPSYVEAVYVNEPRLFGNVTFTSPFIRDLVMGPYDKAYFCINGRPLYCKRFVSQLPRADNAEAVPDAD